MYGDLQRPITHTVPSLSNHPLPVPPLLQVLGPLPFHLVGIMARLTTVLAAAGISVFTISTFDTDYILVKDAAAAVAALAAEGALDCGGLPPAT